MNELYQFITKVTSQFNSITARKLYGKEAIYYKENPIVIISDERVIVRIPSLDRFPNLKAVAEKWSLNDKVMDDWYLLPSSFNKKRNKLIPALEQVIEATKKPKANNPKKTKKKRPSSKKAPTVVTKKEESKSGFQKFLSLFKKK